MHYQKRNGATVRGEEFTHTHKRKRSEENKQSSTSGWMDTAEHMTGYKTETLLLLLTEEEESVANSHYLFTHLLLSLFNPKVSKGRTLSSIIYIHIYIYI